MSKFNCIVSIFLLAIASSNVDSFLMAEYLSRTCEGYTMNLSCSPGYMINIAFANYGRLLFGFMVCPKFGADFNIGCFNAERSISIMRNRCNDRESCSVPATNAVFGDPCSKTYKYLTATYTCTQYVRACEGFSATITCPAGQTIRIMEGFYGRRYTSICPYTDPNAVLNTNCSGGNSTLLVSNACNYQQSCTVAANAVLFGDPCPGTYKYLQISYYCA